MNTVEKFILSSPTIGIDFKLKGSYRKMTVFNEGKGNKKLLKEYLFNEIGRIESEIGYEAGWTAYPRGTKSPNPIKVKRIYKYENESLSSIIVSNHDSNEQLKKYTVKYSKNGISEIIENNEERKNNLLKRREFKYNEDGYLLKEKIITEYVNGIIMQIVNELRRDGTNKIINYEKIKITEFPDGRNLIENMLSGEVKNSLIKVTKEHRSSIHDKVFISTAELVPESSHLIKRILFPQALNKIETHFIYGQHKNNIVEERTIRKDGTYRLYYEYE